MRQQSENEIVIERPSRDVFNAFRKSAEAVGKAQDVFPATGTITAKIPGQMLPYRNASKVRVAVESLGERRARVRFRSESLDGWIGFGSAAAGIDELIRAANSILAGKPVKKPSKYAGIFVFLAVMLPVLGFVAFYFFG